MSFGALEKELKKLEGQIIVSKTIAGNSIWLWFGVDKVRGIYIDPPWRLIHKTKIISTSADFPWEKEDGETEAEYKDRFNLACANSDPMIDAKIISINIDSATSDLVIKFSSGHVFQNFTVWLGEEKWKYVDYESNKRYFVAVAGVTIEDANT